MIDHFSLINYEIKNAGDKKRLLLAEGNQRYKQILGRAFPEIYLSRTFDDRYNRFDWGSFIYNVDDAIIRQIETLLGVCLQNVFLEDDLTECFALDYHTAFDSFGGYQRTEIGELIYQAKPYNRQPLQSHIDSTRLLSQQMIAFIEKHPTYKRSDVIIASPPSRTNKPFDLPSELVGHILNAHSMIDGRSFVIKARQTRPMKDCQTIPEKIDNVRGAFSVTDNSKFRGKTVLLIDDIYQSGFTMNEVGRVLFAAGAKAVIGLAGTKTGRDM